MIHQFIILTILVLIILALILSQFYPTNKNKKAETFRDADSYTARLAVINMFDKHLKRNPTPKEITKYSQYLTDKRIYEAIVTDFSDEMSNFGKKRKKEKKEEKGENQKSEEYKDPVIKGNENQNKAGKKNRDIEEEKKEKEKEKEDEDEEDEEEEDKEEEEEDEDEEEEEEDEEEEEEDEEEEEETLLLRVGEEDDNVNKVKRPFTTQSTILPQSSSNNNFAKVSRRLVDLEKTLSRSLITVKEMIREMNI